MATHSASDFATQFRNAASERRMPLLVDLLAQKPDSLSHILAVVAAREVDQDVFLQSLRYIVTGAPNNLPALRALCWHYIRTADYETAQIYLLQLISYWPQHMDFRRELLRVAMLSVKKPEEAVIELGSAALVDALSAASYRYQLGVAHSTLAAVGQLHELKRQTLIATARSFLSNFDSASSTSTSSQRILWEILASLLKARRVALVGNGPSLRGKNKGSEIDDHDLVVRCNFPKLSSFETDVGSRTDLMFFNEALFGNLPSFLARHASFSSVPMVSVHPEEIEVNGFDETISSLGLRVARLSPPLRLMIRQLFYARPTTGLMAIVLLMAILRKPVSLYGFDFYQNKNDSHYYDQGADVFLGHEVQYESFFYTEILPRLTSD